MFTTKSSIYLYVKNNGISSLQSNLDVALKLYFGEELYKIINHTTLTKVLEYRVTSGNRLIINTLNKIKELFDFDRALKYIECHKTNPRDSSSQRHFTLLYGDEIGLLKYQSKCKSSDSTSLKSRVRKYGEDLGTIEYNRKLKEKHLTEANFIRKYGEVDGKIRWQKLRDTNAGNKTIARFQKLYGDDWEVRWTKLREVESYKNTLDAKIEKYGESKAIDMFNNHMTALHFGASADGFKQKYGDAWQESLRVCKDNTSKTSFISRYGIIEGELRYNEYIARARVSNSLQGFINKYGAEEGLEKFEIKRSKQAFKPSIISQELFNTIHQELGGHVYFSSFNKEYIVANNTACYFYDYVNLDYMRCIEFNGDMWHANPKIFKSTDSPNPYSNWTAEDIWSYDAAKIRLLYDLRGIDTLVVWESDYRQNRAAVVQYCIEFLTGALDG